MKRPQIWMSADFNKTFIISAIMTPLKNYTSHLLQQLYKTVLYINPRKELRGKKCGTLGKPWLYSRPAATSCFKRNYKKNRKHCSNTFMEIWNWTAREPKKTPSHLTVSGSSQPEAMWECSITLLLLMK